ncbi:hypothetical protein EXIGLDRAFT_723221 [Exidia glandulosa HHB12029]|uniref:F-box domain-containing protein n=1 Tax=Exidia glandulosa HHB12029 TaxID=1314781 RepID=A0A165EY38_EXIGL|nr:hypothetical protein EXIGLDRAFT_723221 [Exidia glandulosa HHB12029]
MVTIDDLPNELMPRVFDDCKDVRELVSRSHVSKRWREASYEHPMYWRDVQFLRTDIPLFFKRLNHRPLQTVNVACIDPHQPALDAISENLHRIAKLELHGNDEGVLLWALSHPAPALESLELWTTANEERRAHIPRNFLGGGVAPRLTSLKLVQVIFPFAEIGSACFPSVLSVEIKHNAINEGPYGGWAVPADALDRLAAIFPNLESLHLELYEIELADGGFDPPTILEFPADAPSEATGAFLARLRELKLRDSVASWSTAQHIPLPKIQNITLVRRAIEQPALLACIPMEGQLRISIDIFGDTDGIITISSVEDKKDRTLLMDHESCYGERDLTLLVAHTSWRIVTLSISDIAWHGLLAVAHVGAFSTLKTLRIIVPDDYWYAYGVMNDPDERSALVAPSLRVVLLDRVPAVLERYSWNRSMLESFLASIEFESQVATLALRGVSLEEDLEEAYRTTFRREVVCPTSGDWLDLVMKLETATEEFPESQGS